MLQDAEKALENQSFKYANRNFISKAAAIWNKQNRTTQAAGMNTYIFVCLFHIDE